MCQITDAIDNESAIVQLMKRRGTSINSLSEITSNDAYMRHQASMIHDYDIK